MAIITIIGSGMMGSAMAFPACKNGNTIRLVGSPLDRAIIEHGQKTHEHLTLTHDVNGVKTSFMRPKNVTFHYYEELDECIQLEPGEDEKYYVNRLSELFNSYLETLSDRQLFVFICRYYYSDSVARIADMLKLSKNTIFRDLAAIRSSLREYLEREGYSI